jgi:hypothetical protein
MRTEIALVRGYPARDRPPLNLSWISLEKACRRNGSRQAEAIWEESTAQPYII